MSDRAAFIVAIEGFEGPLDLLLDMARRQKVDLGRISILALAEQYLDYLDDVRRADLPVAAEYLVMAAWLAYLKSQLLLPPVEREAADALDAAAELGERLRRLEALRRAAGWLAQRPCLGSERLQRGAPEAPGASVRTEWSAGLAELMGAWQAVATRDRVVTMTFPARRLWPVEAALERLAKLLTGHDWRDLAAFLPDGFDDGMAGRSAIASSLIAGLELARQGTIDLRQAAPFGPIMVRRLA